MKKIILILFCLCMISFVYAGGCCFDRSMGTCAENAEEGSCSAGDWSDDATCDSVTECQAGCCVLGNGVDFITASSCYFKAQSMGLVENFQQINEVQCKKIQSKQKEGACIVTGRYEDKTCKYTTQSSCTAGQFSEGILCSDDFIKNKYNITCTKTKNTMCYNEDAHFVDSCGNPDVKKQDCDYDKGTICSMNKSSATCKSLDCVDDKGVNRKNGESWCYYDSVKVDYFGLADKSTRDEKYGASEEFVSWVEETVGSRFYRKFCLNGEVQVEPCQDMRNEVCDMGKCMKNPWSDCLLAGNSSKDCDLKWCSFFVGHPGCGIIRAGETLEGWNNGAAATIDTPFCKGSDDRPVTDVASLNKFVEGSDVKLTSVWDPAQNSQVVSGMPAEFRPKIREDMIAASGMQTCRPLNAGGFIYEKQIGSASDSTICTSYGSMQAEVTFWRDKSFNYGDKQNHLLKLPSFSYGLAGITYLNPSGWFSGILAETGDTMNCGGGNTVCSTMWESQKISIEPFFIDSMNRRCQAISDCAGQTNYIGSGGSGKNILNTVRSGNYSVVSCIATTASGGHEAQTCTISFQCMPYEAPKEGKCEECQADEKYPCTEYKCRSIGSNCEFIDSFGINNAYCMKSSDIAAPKILSHSLSPKSPIKPFSSVQINLTTDEDSSCKFSLGKAGGKFEDMTFAFGNTWDKNHSLTLNIPGKIKENISDEEVQYEFLTRDGKYEMFVRCSDPKGNWNLEPYLIKFEVMETPDSVPPALMYFNPKSGSPIEFETTTKSIKFKMNEPAACKWSFSDMNFSEMPYYFNCDLSPSRNGVLHGYECSGILTNISANLSQATPFYIRCKDQPWLAGNETKFYKRNENQKSEVYLLRNSEKLEIVEFAPKGMVIVGPSVNNLTLMVRTKGGGEKGKAICTWKRTYGDQSSLLKNLSITNAILHKQVISNISEGDYDYYVECTDIAGNRVNQTETLSIREDTGAPIISRVYRDKENLKVATSEPSICKFASVLDASVGCSFSLGSTNLTSMTSKAGNLEHSGPWKKGSYYYVKCQDLHGNTNSICSIIGKAV